MAVPLDWRTISKRLKKTARISEQSFNFSHLTHGTSMLSLPEKSAFLGFPFEKAVRQSLTDEAETMALSKKLSAYWVFCHLIHHRRGGGSQHILGLSAVRTPLTQRSRITLQSLSKIWFNKQFPPFGANQLIARSSNLPPLSQGRWRGAVKPPRRRGCASPFLLFSD